MEPSRSAMVTGGAGGIGRAIAERLARDGLAVSVADSPSAQDQVGAVVDGLARPDAAWASRWMSPMPTACGSADDRPGPGWAVDRCRVSGGAPRRQVAECLFRLEVCRRGMSQSIAQELDEHQITVNVYSPGVVSTPMWAGIDAEMTRRRGTEVGSELAGMVSGIPLGRLKTPADVAGVVAFLASWRPATSPASPSSSTAECGSPKTNLQRWTSSPGDEVVLLERLHLH